MNQHKYNISDPSRTEDVEKIQHQIKKDDVAYLEKNYQKAKKNEKDMHNFQIKIKAYLRRLNFYKYSLNSFNFLLENHLVNLTNVNPIGLMNLPDYQDILKKLYKANPEMVMPYIETALSQTKNLATDKVVIEDIMQLAKKNKQYVNLNDVHDDCLYYLLKNNYKSYFTLKELGFSFKQYFKEEKRQNFYTFFAFIYESLTYAKGSAIDKIITDFKGVDIVFSETKLYFPFTDITKDKIRAALRELLLKDQEKNSIFLNSLMNTLTPTTLNGFKSFVNHASILMPDKQEYFNSTFEALYLEKFVPKELVEQNNHSATVKKTKL